MKKSGLLAVAAVIVAIALVACAVFILPESKEDPSSEVLDNPSFVPSRNYAYSEETVNSADWSYWLGNLDMPGISDAKTPTTESEMVERWKIADVLDGGSMVWEVPGSAICIGDKTYFYRGSEDALYCVNTSTGSLIKKVECVSDSVYNMAIAYGDNKIFVPCRSGAYTILKAYDADSLNPLFVSEPISGGEVQGSIIYHDGGVYFGTYGGSYACVSSEDIDTSSSNETAQPLWVLDADGWYNATPAFAGKYCIIAEKGYAVGGTVIYVVDAKTGAVYDTHTLDYEYCVSGLIMYEGRFYISTNAVTDPSKATSEDNTGKSLIIHSFKINTDGSINVSSEKIWRSNIENGGTQSTPVIYNDRLYICGGGSTMGTAEPFTVLDIDDNGNMSLAYRSDILSKSSPSISTAYATADNGYEVYIYIIEYGSVKPGDSTGLVGSADIYVLKDKKGQNEVNVAFTLTPSVEQFAYQSFTLAPNGYVLIRNDSTLFCYGTAAAYSADDVTNAISRVLSSSNVNFKEIGMIEYRYSLLSGSEKSRVTNYSDLQELYCTVSFVVNNTTLEVKIPKGSIAQDPFISTAENKVFTGWKTESGNDWNIWEDRVTEDIVLTAVFADAMKVSFNTGGGSAVDPIYVEKGNVMGYVPDSKRSGYTFAGWFSGNTEYVPNYSKIHSDITLTAKWLSNHTISFNSNGGSEVSGVIHVVYDTKIGTLPATIRTGYSFAGWYHNNTLYTADTVYLLNADITLTAKWEENSAITVSTSKGVSVTASMPSDTEISTVIPYQFAPTVLSLKNYASVPLDTIQITLVGDGISGDLILKLELPVGNGYDKTTVYYYDAVSNSTKTISGTINNGILTVELKGNTTNSGMYALIGIESGSDLPDHT